MMQNNTKWYAGRDSFDLTKMHETLPSGTSYTILDVGN